jgi:hypothetical protein
MRYTPEIRAHEMHAYEVHAHEVYLHEMHARNPGTGRVTGIDSVCRDRTEAL